MLSILPPSKKLLLQLFTNHCIFQYLLIMEVLLWALFLLVQLQDASEDWRLILMFTISNTGVLNLSCFMYSIWGYWSSARPRWMDIGQVLFCSMFMDRHGVKANKLTKKLNKAYIQACWLSKLGQNFFLAGHGRQNRAILPAWIAIHRAGFGLSCPLTELAIHV